MSMHGNYQYRNYSLYLAQWCTHFYIIVPSCRTFWASVRYPDDEALKEAIKEWLEGQTEDFYFRSINSQPEKCHERSALSRDYIEK